jgi:hypothetical protein
MSYIGNTPTSQAFAPGTDTFSGTGSQTAFTLSRNVATVNDIQVVVNNVVQQPSSYTVSGTTLTFSPAPSSGTNNIYVRYLSTNLQTIAPQQGSVYPSSLSTQNALYWDTSGNVGINTTSPTAKFQVSSPGGWSAANWGKGLYVTTTGFSSNPAIGISDASGANNWAIVNLSGSLNFYTAPAITDSSTAGTERMRIDSSGNLLVGTTSAAGVLSVKQSSATVYSNCLSLIDNASTNKWGILVDSGTTRLYFGYNAVSKSYIDQVTGAYTAVSDSRLKENVEPLSAGLSEVLQLNPVTYNFKSDETKANQVGLIAQEVLEVIPEVVGVPIDETNGSYGINYAGLTPVLVKAIQEQQAMIEELKAKVAALEAR